MMPEQLTSRILWFGHASFSIKGDDTIYIDPWKMTTKPNDGDIVVITHSHYDHYSEEDILKVAKPDFQLILPCSMKNEVSGDNCHYLKPGESVKINNTEVEAVRAYNTDKKFHPMDNDWLGYIININGIRIYHAGDTDLIEEMHSISCDVALLPVSGTYVMTAEEAITAVKRIGPRVAIPMHWGDIVGGRTDAERFSGSAPCPVVIKEQVK